MTIRQWIGLMIAGTAVAFVAVSSYAEATEAQRAALEKLARGAAAPWPEMTPEQAAELQEKATKYLAEFQARHLPFGAAADLWWKDASRTELHQYDTLGDSACWTGHYLAALAHQWSVTREEKTLKDINATLDTFDCLTQISGIPGYIARYAGRADDPAYKVYYVPYKSGHFEGIAPWTDYIWLGNSSRDTYDGTRLGLSMVWLLVDDQATKQRAEMIIERILDNLIANDWFIKDGKGHITNPITAFQLVYEQLALRVNPEKYKALKADYDLLFSKASQRPPRVTDIDKKEYFAYNLDWTRWYCLARLETDRKKRALYESALTQMFEDSRTHVNAWFAAAYAAATGDSRNPDARALAQGELMEFPNPPNAMQGYDYTQDPSVEKKTTKDGSLRAKYALNVRLREPDTFVWQRSPTLLKEKQKGYTYDWSGIDLLLPYWVGRAAKVIPAP